MLFFGTARRWFFWYGALSRQTMRDRVYAAGEQRHKRPKLDVKKLEDGNAIRNFLGFGRDIDESTIGQQTKVISLTHHSSPAYLTCWCTYTPRNVSACINIKSKRFFTVPQNVTLYMTPPFQFNTNSLEDSDFHVYKTGSLVLDRKVSKWPSLQHLVNDKKSKYPNTDIIIRLTTCTFTYVMIQAMEPEEPETPEPSSSSDASPPKSFTDSKSKEGRLSLNSVEGIENISREVHTLQTPTKNNQSVVSDDDWRGRLSPEEFLAINNDVESEREWFDAALGPQCSETLLKMVTHKDWYEDERCLPLMASYLAIQLYIEFDKTQTSTSVYFDPHKSRIQPSVQILDQIYKVKLDDKFEKAEPEDNYPSIAYLDKVVPSDCNTLAHGPPPKVEEASEVKLSQSQNAWILPDLQKQQTWIPTRYRPWDFQAAYYMFSYQGNNGVMVVPLDSGAVDLDSNLLKMFCLKNGMCFGKKANTYYAFHPALQGLESPNEDSCLVYGLRHLQPGPVFYIKEQKNITFDFIYGYTVGELKGVYNETSVLKYKEFESMFFPEMRLVKSA